MGMTHVGSGPTGGYADGMMSETHLGISLLIALHQYRTIAPVIQFPSTVIICAQRNLHFCSLPCAYLAVRVKYPTHTSQPPAIFNSHCSAWASAAEPLTAGLAVLLAAVPLAAPPS